MPPPSQAELMSRLSSLPPTYRAYLDPSLQAYARSIIPASLLRSPCSSPCSSQHPSHDYCWSGPHTDEYFFGVLSRDDDFVQTLARWFKQDLFKWTNKPRCPACDAAPGAQASAGMAGPETAEERAGKASRVEVYKCGACSAVHRFPRFNDPRTLLSPAGRRGRCGEFANAFCALLVAVGYEARYVLDLTDHVWCEYYSYSLDRWVHVDPCEAKVDGDGL